MSVTTVSKVEVGKPWRITLSNRSQKTWNNDLLRHNFSVQRPKFDEKAMIDVTKLFLKNHYIILSYEQEDGSPLAQITYIKDGKKIDDILKVKYLERCFRNNNVIFLINVPRNFKVALSKVSYFAFVKDGEIIYSSWKEEDCFKFYLREFLYPEIDALPVTPLVTSTTTPEGTTSIKTSPLEKLSQGKTYSGINIPIVDGPETTDTFEDDTPLPDAEYDSKIIEQNFDVVKETTGTAPKTSTLTGQRAKLAEIGVKTKEDLILPDNREIVYNYMRANHGDILGGELPKK